uniref:Peptidase C1A papain C-terminal domain-containing protein n=1 Tax=Tetradesmus obliquus TaxID=3088 RepID=A0A383VM75_TETOB|eukprot:jgi/Sobl393_1/12379/SZX66625.1
MECEPTLKGCNGAWLDTYFVSASCRGQGYETDFPYNARDTNKCPSNIARNSIKQDMQLKWAEIPSTSDALKSAVDYAPTQIGIMVSNAFYLAGVIPCKEDSYITNYTNRE